MITQTKEELQTKYEQAAKNYRYFTRIGDNAKAKNWLATMEIFDHRLTQMGEN